jgi:hypothetical protein
MESAWVGPWKTRTNPTKIAVAPIQPTAHHQPDSGLFNHDAHDRMGGQSVE